MCGRVNVSDHEGIRALLAMMGMNVWPIAPPRFNVAPSGVLDVVTLANDGHALILKSMYWGFTASGYNDTNRLLFNARSESVFKKPSFRASAQNQRAVVPINGFYEWQATSTGSKRAFHISSSDGTAIALAAVFRTHVECQGEFSEKNQAPQQHQVQQLSLGLCSDEDEEQHDLLTDDEVTQTQNMKFLNEPIKPEKDVCVLTMPANPQVGIVHTRMPVILDSDQAQRWLREGDEALLGAYCRTAEHTNLQIKHVDGFVNKASNDGPACLSVAID